MSPNTDEFYRIQKLPPYVFAVINEMRAKTGRAALNYLTEISSAEFKAEYEKEIPETILGSDFLVRYKTHDDPVTTIQPDATYRVAGPARHPVAENERVMKFISALKSANGGDEKALIAAGELMYGAHESYRDNCTQASACVLGH